MEDGERLEKYLGFWMAPVRASAGQGLDGADWGGVSLSGAAYTWCCHFKNRVRPAQGTRRGGVT